MLESKGRARDRALLAKSRAAKATIKDSDGSRENGCAGEASDVSGVAENKLTKKLHTPPNCPISMPAFRKTLASLTIKSPSTCLEASGRAKIYDGRRESF